MSPAYKYKKIENQTLDKISKAIRLLLCYIVTIFKYVFRKGRQRFTLMIIPHSEKKIWNIYISIFGYIVFILLIIIFVVGIILITINITNTVNNKEYLSKLSEIEVLQRIIVKLENEIDILIFKISELNSDYNVLVERKLELENIISINKDKINILLEYLNNTYLFNLLISFFSGILTSIIGAYIFRKLIRFFSSKKKSYYH